MSLISDLKSQRFSGFAGSVIKTSILCLILLKSSSLEYFSYLSNQTGCRGTNTKGHGKSFDWANNRHFDCFALRSNFGRIDLGFKKCFKKRRTKKTYLAWKSFWTSLIITASILPAAFILLFLQQMVYRLCNTFIHVSANTLEVLGSRRGRIPHFTHLRESHWSSLLEQAMGKVPLGASCIIFHSNAASLCHSISVLGFIFWWIKWRNDDVKYNLHNCARFIGCPHCQSHCVSINLLFVYSTIQRTKV